MNNLGNYDFYGKKRKGIRIEQPSARSEESDALLEEARKFARLVPYAPEPNFGRIQEIKEEIRKGIYLQSYMTEETAARLAIRFMKREQPEPDPSDESNPEQDADS